MELNPARTRQRRYEKENREKERERKRRWRAGLSPGPRPAHAEVVALLARQGGKCGICSASSSGGTGWRSDLDAAGKLRGVLCDRCARGLAGFRAKVKTLRAAIYYVEAHEHRAARLKELL